MKKIILLIASVLAVSSVMAAMAFSSATVKNDANFTIENTDSALLAIMKGNHAATDYDERNDGAEVLTINFDKGYFGDYGLQPNSEYTWLDLFKVRNNSENTVNLKIDFSPSFIQRIPDLADANMEIAVNVNGEWKKIDNRRTDSFVMIENVQPGDVNSIDVKIIQDHPRDQRRGESGNWDGLREFQILVSAEAVTN
ncbi:hypothetical protein [Chengkuizengella axinellae]|uniref:Camelysin metallo-endopeptidase n=1 Tax=Chengkuizengella axinellae TaxID=3064388 RepID=A0ABT9IYF6_9BACL|nr:hypothetical protein [Chengkuizengella sp. 2205SS18-9]MDP5274386.1 hypothetical protein [Chengkuizengella sp. 2205SS18-9]